MATHLPAAANAPGTGGSVDIRPLTKLLRRTARRQSRVEAAIVTCIAIASGLGTCLGLLLVDAVAPLSTGARVLSDVAVVSAIGWSAWALWRRLRQPHDEVATARRIESCLAIPDSVLVNAIEFSSAPSVGQSPALRLAAIEQGTELSREISPRQVVPLRPCLRPLGVALAPCLLVVVARLVAPGLFAATLPRFFDPAGDHPPYTLVTFDVSVSPEPLYAGRPATIAARLGGPEEVRDAWVVFHDEGATRRMPMFHSGEGRFVADLPRVESSSRFHIETSRGRSATRPLTVLDVPLFEEVTAEIEPPAYAGRPSRRQTLDARGLTALAGTTVTVTARSNRPLRAGGLFVTAHAASPAAGTASTAATQDAAPAETTAVQLLKVAGSPNVVRGRMRLTSSGRFSLSLTGEGGAASPEPLEGPLSVIADGPPRVSIISPPPAASVVEGWTVPVVVETADDIGLANVTLLVEVNDAAAVPIPLVLSPDPSTSARGEVSLDLTKLAARAGDSISLTATAADNFPQAPHSTRSETHTLQVISREEYLQSARQKYALNELIDEVRSLRNVLAEKSAEGKRLLSGIDESRKLQSEESASQADQVAASTGSPATPEDVAQSGATNRSTDPTPAAPGALSPELQDALHRFADELGALAEQIQQRADAPRLYDIEEPYSELLSQGVHDLHEQAALGLELANAGATPATQEHLQEFESALSRFRESQFRASAQPQQSLDDLEAGLESLRQADDHLKTAERLDALSRQQQDLANKLAAIESERSGGDPSKPPPSPPLEEVVAEQRQLASEARQLAGDMTSATVASTIDASELQRQVRELAQALTEGTIARSQQEAADRAERGEIAAAREAAQQASTDLDQLKDRIPARGQIEQSLTHALSRRVGLSIEAIRDLLDQLAGMRSLAGAPGLDRGSSTRPASSNDDSARPSASGARGAGMPSAVPQSPSRSGIVLGPRSAVSNPFRSPLLPPRRIEPVSEAGQSGGATSPAVETLHPDARASRSVPLDSLRGVPVRYRSEVEAYFQRLAEDAAK